MHRGYRQADHKPVTIKLFNTKTPTATAIARLIHEYEITKDLNLEGIVKAYSLESQPGRLALILDDFQGVTLESLIRAGALDLTTALQIAVQLARIMARLHQQNIIHKDINPHHILIHRQTGVVALTDFSIATILARETPQVSNLHLLNGTLAYNSPEQTGRMNRGLDYRTDFYSFGVTLYEMLTGKLPFVASDSLELIHCHIARQPVPPCQVQTAIPQTVSDIVMKLLSKTAEERYHSAYGLAADLEQCLAQLEAKGCIDDFVPGLQDVSYKFQIPQRLYGREQDIKVLLDAFERVCSGPPELLLVTGYSGIGKSTLVHEAHKPIARQRGYFISGKFDQYKRNIPYSALIQAFQGLIQQLLTESEEQIANWRQALTHALGANAQVIVDVIPEVELIIGPQPPVAQQGPQESQNRFNLVFQNFIGVFTQQAHPLVIFLDDLQWADAGSLNLLRILMTDPASRYLLMIGAYRDNEVSQAHPLVAALDDIRKAQTLVQQIELGPLDLACVNELVADTLYCAPARSRPLAQLLLRKTAGNPFFLNQLLQSFYRDQLVKFDPDVLSWQWDLKQIEDSGITDNVVELMSGKIQRISPQAQHILKLAACIGNQFDLETLAIIHEKSRVETLSDLWEAVQEGLIIAPPNAVTQMQELPPQELDELGLNTLAVTYKFLHDRVQQAAYAQIADEQKKIIHLKLGQLLLQNTAAGEHDEKLFDIVNHLNLGRALMHDQVQQDSLAELNLRAGKKAKASAAYEASSRYLADGISLLPPDSWQTRYDLSFALSFERYECAYLLGDYEATEPMFEQLLAQANSVLDKARVYAMRVTSYATRAMHQEACDAGREALALLGMNIPAAPNKFSILSRLLKVKASVGRKPIKSLTRLPDMADPEKRAIVFLLREMTGSAYQVTPEIFAVVVLELTYTSLRFGNTAWAHQGYGLYGAILCGVLGDLKAGNEFGQLGLAIAEKYNDVSSISRSCFIWAAFSNHWMRHAKTNLTLFQRAYETALESGDYHCLEYVVANTPFHKLLLGFPLQEVYEAADKQLDFVQRVKYEDGLNFLKTYKQTVRCLQGATASHSSFSDADYDEAAERRHMQSTTGQLPLHWYAINKLMTLYLFGEYEGALEMALLSDSMVELSAGFWYVAIHYWYYSLTLAALYPMATRELRAKYRRTLQSNQRKMKKWARYCPENFQHQYLLVQAEIARLTHKDSAAMQLYDDAIQSAQEQGYMQNAALASELAGRFHLARGQSNIAKSYLVEAHYGYVQWGATGKVAALEQQYPDLLVNAISPSPAVTGIITAQDTTIPDPLAEAKSSALDLSTVIKTAQALSGEIDLSRLLRQLMRFAIENAGAQKGMLLLEKGGKLVIEAEGAVDEPEVAVLQSSPLGERGDAPAAIIHYVARTGESLVLQDATREGIFTADPYVLADQPHSILCAPIVHQSKLIGILYLENALTPGVFNQDRLEVLNIISAQAAISLQNAILYRDLNDAKVSLQNSNELLEESNRTLEEKVVARTVELQTKNQQLEQTLSALKEMQNKVIIQEKMASLGTLTAGVAHEIKNPLNFVNNFALLSVDLVNELTELITQQEAHWDDKTKEYLDEILHDLELNAQKITEHGKRADSIVRSMLLHSRGQAGQVEATDLNVLVEEAANLIYHGQRATDAAFNVTFEKDFDPALGTVQVVPQEISRVVLNVVSNACYAVQQKQRQAGTGYNPCVCLSTRRLPDHVEIRIRDNGDGIAPAALEKIFNPFFTTKPAGEGTGLGLSLSYDIIVHQHGGDLKVETEPGQYTEFIINLPSKG